MQHPLRHAEESTRRAIALVLMGAIDLAISGALVWSIVNDGFALAYLALVVIGGIGLVMGCSSILMRLGWCPKESADSDADEAENPPKPTDEEPCEASPSDKHARSERIGGLITLVAGIFTLAISHAIPLAAISAAGLLFGLPLIRMVVNLSPAWLKEESEEEAGSTDGYQRDPFLENAGGLISAVLVIMLSYAFALEAFRIPTGSMEPTLYGDPVMGDRTIVNKLTRSFREPQRGDISVLRFPLGRAAPYVKRIVGEPGEKLLIAQGDVYIQGEGDAWPRIWRKQGRVRESMWIPYHEHAGGSITFQRDFAGLSGKASSSDGVITLAVENDKPARIRFPKEGSITDNNPTSDSSQQTEMLYGNESVSDVRVSFDWSMGESALTTRIIRADGSILALQLGGDEPPVVSVQHPGMETPKSLEVTIPGISDADELEFLSIRFGCADGDVELLLDGTRCEVESFETLLESKLRKLAESGRPIDPTTPAGMKRLVQLLPPQGRTQVEFSLAQGKAELSNIRFERDIHYIGRVRYVELISEAGQHAIKVAEGPSLPWACDCGDDYLALGDNSQNSLDSRLWVQLTLHTKSGERYALQDKAVYGAAMLNPAQIESIGRWHTRMHNVMQRIAHGASEESKAHELVLSQADGDAAIAALESDLLHAIQNAEFGQRLEFTDIYSIPRSINVAEIESLELAYTPGVPLKLIDGQVLGSVFPEPRFVD